MTVAEGQPVRFAVPVTGNVGVKARLVGDADASPVSRLAACGRQGRDHGGLRNPRRFGHRGHAGGAAIYAFAKHEGTAYGEGPWSAGIGLVVAEVKPAVILTPNAGAVVYSSYITVTTQPLACTGNISDNTLYTQLKITKDEEGILTVAETVRTGSDTLHSFVGVDAVEGGTYHIFARKNGAVCGMGPWSKARAVTIKNTLVTPGGRRLYAHSSGMGTVMEYNDGVLRKLLVLYSWFRDKKTFGTYGTDSPLTNYATANTRGDWYLNTSNAANNNAATVMTDAQINALWAASIDTKTAKQNCDQWMTRNGITDSQGIIGVPAVAYARSVSVDGAACDVPNIQTLMRIFLEAEAIDALDPTVAANRTKALGSQNSGGFWNGMGTGGAWASTEYNSYHVRYVHRNGGCNYAGKGNEDFVVPVQEL